MPQKRHGPSTRTYDCSLVFEKYEKLKKKEKVELVTVLLYCCTIGVDCTSSVKDQWVCTLSLYTMKNNFESRSLNNYFNNNIIILTT